MFQFPRSNNESAVDLPFKVDDVLAFASSKAAYKDAKLRKLFASEEGDDGLPVRTFPTAFLDEDDKIVGWYLPNVFSPRISVSSPSYRE